MIKGIFHLFGMIFLAGLVIGAYVGYQAGYSSAVDQAAGYSRNLGQH